MNHGPRDDLAAWIALSLVKGLGSATFCQLLLTFKTPEAILAAHRSALREVVSDEVADGILSIDTSAEIQSSIQQTLDWLAQPGNHMLTLADPHYPPRLLQIDQPPPVLYAKGDLQVLLRPAIAVVGSRHATPQGEQTATAFAQSLCEAGFSVVSGLALGIDGAAHRGALQANGATIAVVGTGLDIVYPARHKALAHAIAGHGLLLSEFALGTPSIPHHFPRRNRIISGLSEGCLVVEANVDSGSLITARLAAEQGREVFAIPGSIHSPVAKGCHGLIKQGAKLVECIEDILSEFPQWQGALATAKHDPNGPLPERAQLPPQALSILDCMGFDPVFADQIAARSGLTSSEVSTMLTVLELAGMVSNMSNGQIQRLV